MSYSEIGLWILLGLGFSSWVLMHFWLPDPPPDIFGRYLTTIVAGAVGAVIGGFVASRGLASSDPMPGILAAAAGGVFLSSAVGFVTGVARKSVH